MYLKTMLYFIIGILMFSCAQEDKSETEIPQEIMNEPETTPETDNTINYLALGDSYTIGQSVCSTCKFPIQLKDSLLARYPNMDIEVKIIATTGWTTTNLINAIENEQPSSNNDLVTLLIGVNNQYQGKPFSLYQSEFPSLLEKAIKFAGGRTDNVVVVSIPDYAYTPFGQNSGNPEKITQEIDQYNAFANTHCSSKGVSFVNITDITRQG
ncbi:GDSL-type esterase/lipase family protein, partial [Aegicerativicinus sediminis]